MIHDTYGRERERRVMLLHFVECGRPWLLHWRGVHTHRMWSHFWGTFLGKCENTQIHLLHMIHMVHDTYDTHDTYSQDSWSHFWDKCGNYYTGVEHRSGVAEPTWSQCGENMRHRPPGCAADPPEGKNKKTYENSRWQKSRIVKKTMGFLHGFCMVVKSRKIDMQKLLKKPLVLVCFLDRHAEKYIICKEKTRGDKRAR